MLSLTAQHHVYPLPQNQSPLPSQNQFHPLLYWHMYTTSSPTSCPAIKSISHFYSPFTSSGSKQLPYYWQLKLDKLQLDKLSFQFWLKTTPLLLTTQAWQAPARQAQLPSLTLRHQPLRLILLTDYLFTCGTPEVSSTNLELFNHLFIPLPSASSPLLKHGCLPPFSVKRFYQLTLQFTVKTENRVVVVFF